MTEEEQKILFKDLCARAPYDTKIAYNVYGKLPISRAFGISNHELLFEGYEIEHCKPFLRPMSSMTDEEKEELKNKCVHNGTEEDWFGVRSVWGIEILYKYNTRQWDNSIEISHINMDAIDWLNAHHIDYRQLIEQGLALEAPVGMYNFE